MDRVSALHHTRTFEIVHPEKFLRIGPVCNYVSSRPISARYCAEYLHLKTNPLYQHIVVLTASILMLLLTLGLRETYTLNRLSSFQNLIRKGGKFDHHSERPKVLLPLRHCPYVFICPLCIYVPSSTRVARPKLIAGRPCNFRLAYNYS